MKKVSSDILDPYCGLGCGWSRPVPETVLKGKKAAAKKYASKQEEAKALRQARVATRKTIIKRAEKYAQEYRQARVDLVKARRAAKVAGQLFVEPEAKIGFVVRIRGINNVSPKARKILQLLRLRQIHNGVFVRLTKPVIEMLRIVQPYIAYGYPSLKTVRELIYKRGFAKLNSERIPITDNALIEQHLGKHGIICVEDLVHEIFTSGPNFKYASRFLWPFKLNAPRGGFVQKLRNFTEGGDAGNRQQYINDLVSRMN